MADQPDGSGTRSGCGCYDGAVGAIGSEDIQPVVGVTGTPVNNPAANTLYVVAATEENGSYFMRPNAINIPTGAKRANSPALITATIARTGNRHVFHGVAGVRKM